MNWHRHSHLWANRTEEIAMQTEKHWDSFDVAYLHWWCSNIYGIIVTTAPQVTPESSVSALPRLANGTRPSKPKTKLCELPSNWCWRMSTCTRFALFQIICQNCYKCNICTHHSKLSTLTLWPRLLREGAVSLRHGTLVILGSAAMS